MHVAYAETYQVTTKEPEKVVRELDAASTYLQKAMKSRLSGAKTQKKMIGIVKTLKELKANANSGGPEVQDLYEAAISELDNLVQEL